MFEKDSLPFGIVAALVLPVLGAVFIFGVFEGFDQMDWMSSEGFRPMFRERTASIVGIAMNAWLINRYSKARKHNTVRGIVISTTLLVISWLLIFGKYVL